LHKYQEHRMETKKICLFGDAKVGKSSFVQCLMKGECDKKYVATLGVEVHPIRRNNKCYNIWDCAGDPRFYGLGDGYYVQSQGAIIMCDATNPDSIRNVQNWVTEYRRMDQNGRVVVVVNKIDSNPGDLNRVTSIDMFGNKFECVYISCRTNEGVENVLNLF